MYGDSQSTSTAPAAEASAPSVISSPAGRRWLPANRWARRALYGVAGLLGLWALGWLAVPPLLKWQGEKIASGQLGRAVRIGAVDFKPWTLELTLNDVAVGGAAGAPDQLSVKRIYANAALQSLFRLAPVVDAIQVEAPALRLTHLGDGHYDIDDILAKLAARPQPAEATEPARFALYNIDLSGGRIDFDDRAVKRQHEVRDLRLTLPFVSNLPSERQIKVQPQLAFVANGSAFDSRAEALPFADSRQTDAAFRLTQLDLKPYLGYWPASLPIKLQSAVIDADLRLDFEQTPKPSLRLSGALAVSGLKSVDGQGAEALAFDALKVQLAEVRLLQPFAGVVAAAQDEALFIAWEEAEGKRTELAAALAGRSAATLLIGPEAGFTAAEVDLAVAAGARVISLGTRRLRSETAALTAAVRLLDAAGELG